MTMNIIYILMNNNNYISMIIIYILMNNNCVPFFE